MSSPSVPPTATPPAATHWLSGLSVRRVVVALALGVLVALALNPIFITPFPILLGRTLIIAMVLVLAFTLAGNWSQSLVPRWVMQVVAVGLAAPLATFALYVLFVGGDVARLLQHEGLLSGFFWIAGSSLVIGLVLTLGALYRERDAQARAQALQFELERSMLERQALDAQLRALHAQIEPHFLFNTLANVQALVEAGSPRAATVLRSLIAYLRAAMPRLRDNGSTLGAEIDLVRAYLEVMHLRMPDRLSYALELPPELGGLRFPSMALLTLVENAIRHGIDPSEQGGRIEIGAHRAEHGVVRVWVLDTGVGLSETSQPGTGLANLRQRLVAFFGPNARLELSEPALHGVRAEIVFETDR